jgi:hypothetical protein
MATVSIDSPVLGVLEDVRVPFDDLAVERGLIQNEGEGRPKTCPIGRK